MAIFNSYFDITRGLNHISRMRCFGDVSKKPHRDFKKVSSFLQALINGSEKKHRTGTDAVEDKSGFIVCFWWSHRVGQALLMVLIDPNRLDATSVAFLSVPALLQGLGESRYEHYRCSAACGRSLQILCLPVLPVLPPCALNYTDCIYIYIYYIILYII